jgi:hypothetical protein
MSKHNYELRRLNEEEHKLELELLDPLTDLLTPVESEDEDENTQKDEQSNISIQIFKNSLMDTPAIPQRPTAYSERYVDLEYRQKAEKKVKNAKHVLQTTLNLEQIIDSDVYSGHVSRIRQLYPDNGGRTNIRKLIAIVCYTEDVANH